jgi:hypothetical protein
LTGLGYAEFSAVAKSVFVQVASDEYGLRGRPTNTSRVSAMTGISRKEVSRIRNADDQTRWTPSMESSPINSILHFWRHDKTFCTSIGKPRALTFEGDAGFSGLVAKYAGDIPAGAMRASLIRAGSVSEIDHDRLVPNEDYIFPTGVSDDFVHGLGFSLGNLGGTLAHNMALRLNPGTTKAHLLANGRFERAAWSEYLPDSAANDFRQWVEGRFWPLLTEADHWIGEHELPQDEWGSTDRRATGVGVYFFQED